MIKFLKTLFSPRIVIKKNGYFYIQKGIFFARYLNKDSDDDYWWSEEDSRYGAFGSHREALARWKKYKQRRQSLVVEVLE